MPFLVFIYTCADVAGYFQAMTLVENFYQPVFPLECFLGPTLMCMLYKTISFHVPMQHSADNTYRVTLVATFRMLVDPALHRISIAEHFTKGISGFRAILTEPYGQEPIPRRLAR